MAEHLFPVCSPALLKGKQALRRPEDLSHVTLLHTSAHDDWRLWLTAAGLPPEISQNPGLTFDLAFMTIQAAIDGVGVAMGQTAYVADDIAKGRLVVPFDIAMPADAGFYIVAPQGKATMPKINAFRDWILTTAENERNAQASQTHSGKRALIA